MADEQVACWPSGHVREITGKVDNKLHGRQQTWYEDGQPRQDYNYERGRQHGRQQTWHAGGQR